MTHVTSIFLTELKTYSSWKRAPIGSLLQVRAVKDNAILVGMRCELKLAGNAPHPCFLVLGDKDCGVLLDSERLRDPAVDVSSLREIRVKDPAPVAYSEAHFQQSGILCETDIGSGHLLVRGMLRGNMSAFVWISDPTENTPKGTVITETPPKLFVHGVVEVAERPKANTLNP